MTRNPFDDIERMFDRMSSQLEPLEDDLFKGSVAVDIEDRGDEYVVTADLPGFEPDDIDVELAGETLTISAEHAGESEVESDEERRGETEGRYIRRERSERSVNRSVRLPEPLEEEGTDATHRNGVLTVTLPKQRGDEGGRSIPIS